MISIRLVEFSGSGFWSVLSRQKRHGMPDVRFLKESWTAFTHFCRRKASVKVTTYPTIIEMQSPVLDQDWISDTPACGRQAIASKSVSTGVKSMSCVPSSLILSSNSGSRTKEYCLKKGEISDDFGLCYLNLQTWCRFGRQLVSALMDCRPQMLCSCGSVVRALR